MRVYGERGRKLLEVPVAVGSKDAWQNCEATQRIPHGEPRSVTRGSAPIQRPVCIVLKMRKSAVVMVPEPPLSTLKTLGGAGEATRISSPRVESSSTISAISARSGMRRCLGEMTTSLGNHLENNNEAGIVGIKKPPYSRSASIRR